jgi:hypothetical protein
MQNLEQDNLGSDSRPNILQMPQDYYDWVFAADGKSAVIPEREIKIELLGYDREGPIYPSADPKITLHPLRFMYSSPKINFSFSVERQLAWTVLPEHSAHDISVNLLWRLNCNKVVLEQENGTTIIMPSLSQIDYAILQKDISDALVIWPDRADEATARPDCVLYENVSRYRYIGLPKHDVLTLGCWVDGDWLENGYCLQTNGAGGSYFNARRLAIDPNFVQLWHESNSNWQFNNDSISNDPLLVQLSLDGFERDFNTASFPIAGKYKFKLKCEKFIAPFEASLRKEDVRFNGQAPNILHWTVQFDYLTQNPYAISPQAYTKLKFASTLERLELNRSLGTLPFSRPQQIFIFENLVASALMRWQFQSAFENSKVGSVTHGSRIISTSFYSSLNRELGLDCSSLNLFEHFKESWRPHLESAS